MDVNSITTDKLMKLLRGKPDEFENYIFDGSVILTELLEKLRKSRGISKTDIINRTGLSKAYVYQVFDGTYVPGRNALLIIALTLNVSVEDTQRLLALARKPALYPKIKRDAAIIICLSKNLSAAEADEFLRGIGEGSLL